MCSIKNLRKEIRNVERLIHRRHKVLSKSKEADTGGFPTSLEYKGWFEKETILSSLSSEGEKCKVNETDSMTEYSYSLRDEQIKEKCFMCSPQDKHQREKGFTLKPSSKTREIKPQKLKEKTDEINFIRAEEKQRWQLYQKNTEEKEFYKSLHHNELSTLRNQEFYSEEQEAIQRAMASRASVVSARNKILPESAYSGI
ncbi:hypothetical protein J437_LFUL004696 [Ladona fulva]|uniref:Uncharacterized protein n=1 Tax=Ladona fulva TaxID=123851 RepID=A0A8K0KV13_LADFU|nr:hypothetical protein J437_LFUL004696 [Ladona fulva]